MIHWIYFSCNYIAVFAVQVTCVYLQLPQFILNRLFPSIPLIMSYLFTAPIVQMVAKNIYCTSSDLKL